MQNEECEMQNADAPPDTESTARVGFLSLCTRRDIVGRALRVAAVVGTILVAINHGDILFGGQVNAARILRMALTYCVPYAVATYASVQAIRGEKRARSITPVQR